MYYCPPCRWDLMGSEDNYDIAIQVKAAIPYELRIQQYLMGDPSEFSETSHIHTVR